MYPIGKTARESMCFENLPLEKKLKIAITVISECLVKGTYYEYLPILDKDKVVAYLVNNYKEENAICISRLITRVQEFYFEKHIKLI